MALGALLLVGCANNVGLNPETNVSKFDGVKTVSIQPHGADCCIAIGAFWTEKVPDMAVLNLTTYVKYMNLESAELRIDDKIIQLQPVDTLTKFEQMLPGDNVVNMPTSTRGFALSLADLRRVMAAKTAMIRITTLSDGGIVGTIRDGQSDTKAYYALQRFLSQIPGK
ncbi:Uncharacterised protein [Klebsiella pneumoniae]|uniref:Uncharacterized protein n=1 Tax=Klebsiella pneumoniae TaxID=573 RepID=A0A2X1QFQ7_KLEPN|nr:Uncharacterised protein [Klebsiella pneumoniae]STS58492.1 Uncharacterised protein [Klebsiella pneumoniae]STT61050.1 Uncharacterised protein [Klebsiella pneumoniae]STU27191.1 Uncharacterised protein [Klebsiella pneumoniae]STU29494.1 Uncharacterised protein [Klebsiella pneumoniae]